MSLTRANSESIIVQRVGALMVLVDFAITIVGTNANLNDPIGRAIRALGYTVTDVTSVADADVAQVPVASYDKYFDYCEYYTLINILGNYDDVDIRVGPRSEKLSQTVKLLEGKIARKEKMLETLYGLGFPTLSSGNINNLFAEHN